MFNKKIGIITPWFGRFAGGAELLARGMARELNKRGVRTSCIHDVLTVSLRQLVAGPL